MKRIQFYIIVLAACSLGVGTVHCGWAQNLEGISKQKPFKVSGSIGAGATYYSSNEPGLSRPPYSWSVYGSLTAQVYGISLPLSFTVNQYGKSYSQPFSQFGISPTYKWAKLHLGYRYMQFSPLTYDGQSFRGAGIELNPKLFRFAAFYGKLNKKVNEDTSSGRFVQPQFARTGYGLKIGIGNYSSYFDLIYLYAKDDSASAKLINKQLITPQENSVLGTSMKLTLLKKIIFSSDIAVSGLTQNFGDSIPTKDSGVLARAFKRIGRTNESTLVDWAGQSSLQLLLKGYTTTIGYRIVRPGFKSLGTPYMLNDVALLNWLNNFNLLSGKLNITTTLSSQHNNLKKTLPTEMQTLVGSISMNALLSRQFNLNLNYAGYRIRQKDGTLRLTDSTRLHQVIHQVNLTPSFITSNTYHSHSVSANAGYMLLDDKNPLSTRSSSSNNSSGSLSYTHGWVKKSVGLSLTGLYNQYRQDTNYYRTLGATIGGNAALLKEKALSVQGAVGYLLNQSSYGNARNNLTFSFNAGYHRQHHSLTLYANYVYTPFNPINNIIYKQVAQAVATKNLAGGISYTYSF